MASLAQSRPMDDNQHAPCAHISIATTTDNHESARAIARALVEARLAACVQLSAPIESVYRWQGSVETATEWRLTIKTRADRFANVASAIRKLHPYSVPQILATPVVAGNADYLAWLDESLGS